MTSVAGSKPSFAAREAAGDGGGSGPGFRQTEVILDAFGVAEANWRLGARDLHLDSRCNRAVPTRRSLEPIASYILDQRE
jgi:hypothetical protein